MKPAFATLKGHFPTRDLTDTAALYAELGWVDLIGDAAFRNTCATRMSLALVKSGLALPGRMRILAGRFKGCRIEPGQAKLSLILQRREMLGAPEKFRTQVAEGEIRGRCGIVSFWHIHPEQDLELGHIDLVFPGADGALRCANQCYWGASAVWFWALD